MKTYLLKKERYNNKGCLKKGVGIEGLTNQEV